MDKLIPFQFRGRQIRVIVISGEPWFVARDACTVLELGNSSQAISRLDDDERDLISNDTHGGKQAMAIVSESGLYSLILGSRKPEAHEFKRWITHDVLPQIRKTGSYSVQPKLPQTYSEALRLAADLWDENQKLLPKADYFDALIDRNLLTNFRDTAKELKVRESEFINWLLDKHYVYRDSGKKLKPYAAYVPSLFEMKEWEKDKKAGNQTLITPRGRETFRLLLDRDLLPAFESKVECP